MRILNRKAHFWLEQLPDWEILGQEVYKTGRGCFPRAARVSWGLLGESSQTRRACWALHLPHLGAGGALRGRRQRSPTEPVVQPGGSSPGRLLITDMP